MYDPIYSSNVGLCGFRCRVGQCKRVVATYRGIQMHCKRVHGLVAQMTLPGMEKANGKEEPASKHEPIRLTDADLDDGDALDRAVVQQRKFSTQD